MAEKGRAGQTFAKNINFVTRELINDAKVF
jgi:hypothetical protein